MNRENYAAAKKLVAGAKRILVSGHLSPDGDSLGSMIALARLLRNEGYEAFATADLNALGKPGFPSAFKSAVANASCPVWRRRRANAIIEPRESPSGLRCPETRIRLAPATSFFAAA